MEISKSYNHFEFCRTWRKTLLQKYKIFNMHVQADPRAKGPPELFIAP
eukprot:UN16895